MISSVLIEVASGTVLAGLPDPSPATPPGMGGLMTIVNWLAWFAILGAIAAAVVSTAVLAFAGITGREMQGFKGFAIALLAAVMVGAVGGLIQAVI